MLYRYIRYSHSDAVPWRSRYEMLKLQWIRCYTIVMAGLVLSGSRPTTPAFTSGRRAIMAATCGWECDTWGARGWRRRRLPFQTMRGLWRQTRISTLAGGGGGSDGWQLQWRLWCVMSSLNPPPPSLSLTHTYTHTYIHDLFSAI